MTIRKKAFYTTSVLVIGLLALMYVIFRTAIIGNFEKLEEQLLRKDVARSIDALNEDISNLDRTVLDYAAWDDTYTFIQEKNTEYVESNLLESGFAKMNINFLLITNASGQVLHSSGFDLEANKPLSVPPGLLSLFSEGSTLIQHTTPDSAQKGILSTSEGKFIFSS